MLNTLASIAPAPLVEFQLRRIEAFERQLAPFKRRLMADIEGTVLEIGPGLGQNFGYISRGSRWIGVEPDVEMHDFLLEEASEEGLVPEVIAASAESIPLDDASVDAVIGTFVLCSVDDPCKVLQEIVRVLIPGGMYVFIEHVADRPGSLACRAQRLINPIWRRASDGCNLTRDTEPIIAAAGFELLEIERHRIRRLLLDPHIMGRAVR